MRLVWVLWYRIERQGAWSRNVNPHQLTSVLSTGRDLYLGDLLGRNVTETSPVLQSAEKPKFAFQSAVS